MSKINQQQAQEIINKFVQGSGTTQLATEYNIWHTTIGNIIRGDTWKSCQRPEGIKKLLRSQHRLRSGSKCKDLPNLTELQNDILIGSLLGDGSLSKVKLRKNSRL